MTERFIINPDMQDILDGMDTEELCEFANLQEDPTSNAPAELLTYIRYVIFQGDPSMENLDRAIRRAEGWVNSTPPDDSDLVRRYEILGTILARRLQFNNVERNGQEISAL